LDKSIINREEWSKIIFETSPDAIIVTDLDGNIIDCNQAALDISVFNSKEELIGFNGLNAIYPGDKERIKRYIKNLYKNSVLKDIELKILNKKGKVFPVEISASVISDKNGNPSAFICIIKDITQRKKIEDDLKAAYENLENKVKERTNELENANVALSKSEENFRQIAETIEEVFWIIDPKMSRVIYISPAYEKIWGRKRQDLYDNPKAWIDAIHPQDRDLSMKMIWRGSREKIDDVSKGFEYRIIRPDGEIVWIWTKAFLIKDKSGDVVRLTGIASDITNRKKVEEELKDSESYYRTIFENTGTASFIIEENSIISLVNAECEGISGYSKEEIEDKKKWQEFVYPEDLQKMEEYHRLRILNPELAPSNYEFRFMDRYGEVKNVNLTIALIPRTKKSVVSILDITERKLAEKEIKERSEKMNILNKIIITANRSGSVKSLLKDVLEQTLNLLPFDGGEIYLIDKEIGIAKVFHSKGSSESFKTLKINDQPHRLIYINGKSAFRNDLDRYSLEINNQSDSQSIAIVPIFSKGEIIGSLSLASKEKHFFTDEEKEIIRSIGNEIGNVIGKLIAEEEMEKLIEELKRSNEELEQFAYITSHDLQEPLRTIASFTQLLERRYKGKLDSDADEFMDYIVDASIRMKQMIQGLLEYSRIGKGGLEFKTVNLDELLGEVLSNLKAVIDKSNAKISWDKLPEPIGDSKLLLQLFQNLIGNSIKFRKSDESPIIHISFMNSKNEYKDVFCVEDNGIGIEEQYTDRIFKVFKRLHTIDVYKGTGIGLATCRRIVEHHGGHIWVESELNKGSRFYFTLKS